MMMMITMIMLSVISSATDKMRGSPKSSAFCRAVADKCHGNTYFLAA